MPRARSTLSTGIITFKTLFVFLTFSIGCFDRVCSNNSVFDQVANYLESLEVARDDYYSQEKTDLLIETVFNRFGDYCSECNSSSSAADCDKPRAEDIFQILSVNSSSFLSSEEFAQASMILFYEITLIPGICSSGGGGGNSSAAINNTNYDSVVNQFRSNLGGPFNEESLSRILASFNETYIAESSVKCFTAEQIYLEVNITDHEGDLTNQQLEAVSSMVVANLLQGFCIGASNALQRPEYFIEEVFHLYEDEDGIITEEGFENMLKQLSIGNTSSQVDDNQEEVEEDVHDHAKRSVENQWPKLQSARLIRDISDEEHQEEEVVHQCYSVDNLWSIFEVDHSVGMSPEKFLELCPALVQQIVSGACLPEDHEDVAETATPVAASGGGSTRAEVYGYGTLAVFIISSLAILGILTVPLLNKMVYAYLIQLFIALAVGTMAGDALLHLLPEALGLHGHEEDESHEDHSEEEDLDYLWKSMSVLAAIYGFFVFEKASKVILNLIRSKKGEYKKKDLNNSIPPSYIHAHDNLAMNHHDETDINNFTHPETALSSIPTSQLYMTENPSSDKNKKLTSTALLVLLGDGLHNIADGLAIGAAFSGNIFVGISTAIAVFCHELPHELGDFAVLLNSGLSYKKALLFNTLSACSAFIGLYIGILVGEMEEARSWIFAVTAGIFLYIALTSLLPEMQQYDHKESNQCLVFFLHNLGILIGIAIMFLIAFYEEEINIS